MADNANIDTQVIANLVIHDGGGRVLLTKYDSEVDRWWLPGQDVEPFTHPDDEAKKIVDSLQISAQGLAFKRVQSFRGRRGWHLVFDYMVLASGEPAEPARWFDAGDMPRTMHGDWEKNVVKDLIQEAAAGDVH